MLCGLLPTLPRLITPDFCLDDAFIHLSYVKSLHLGDGLSYNPHDFETGMSSPLWVFLLALIPAVSPPVWTVKLVGVLSHVTTSLLAMRLAQRVAPREHAASAQLWGGLAVAAVPLLVQASVSGMCVSVTALLLVAATDASIASDTGGGRRALASAGLSALAYLGRPESLAFCGLLAGCAWLRTRRLHAWTPLLGAALSAAAWAGYLLVVSGYPLPNTFYVKGEGLHWASLGYLVTDLLPFQPALISITGPLAIALAYRRGDAGLRRRMRELAFICIGSLLAIALTRNLGHGTLFFHSRHLMPVMWIPALLVGVGIATLRTRLRPLLALPFVLVSLATLVYNDRLAAGQERGVRKLHVDVAAFVSRSLPSDAVLAVEGAGALRYFTPRSMRVIDLMGLNTGAIAHAPATAAAKLCFAATRGVTHLAYLGSWHASIRSFLELEVMAVFEEPRYDQTLPPTAYAVAVSRVLRAREDFLLPCRQLAVTEGWLPR